jgi:hypothetical protein
MQLRTRIEGGGTRPLEDWGVDSEYGILRDVLIGPIDHFAWQPGNAVSQRAERVGLQFDFSVARRQYQEMVDVYRQAGVDPRKRLTRSLRSSRIECSKMHGLATANVSPARNRDPSSDFPYR